MAPHTHIARNSLVLYLRMFLILIINLYTSRLILKYLGVVDYGVYNVIGGVVGLFTLLSNSLSNAISRFLTLSLGKNDIESLKKIFCTSVNIQIVLALCICLLIETLGGWFLNHKLNIPSSRLYAANWILHLSLLTFSVGLISVPYNALIIAHEKMSAFAYIGVLEVFLKLCAAASLAFISYDKLISWTVSLAIISIIIRFIYSRYCSKKFVECKYYFLFDKKLLQQMGGFAGWSFIGESAGVLKNEGINVLLNLFFGPIVNAANGIAMQVNAMVAQFSSSFLTAVNPQITKRYASEELLKVYQFVKDSTRLSFYLIFIAIVPILYSTKFLLGLWLHTVPDYSVVFVRLVLISAIIESICYPMITLQRATGVMRNYQIVTGSVHLLNFPIAWIFLRLEFPPEVVFYIAIVLGIINIWVRLIMLRKILPISISDFFREVIGRGLSVAIFVSLPLFYFSYWFPLNDIWKLIISFFTPIVIIYIVGITRSEKEMFFIYISSRLRK